MDNYGSAVVDGRKLKRARKKARFVGCYVRVVICVVELFLLHHPISLFPTHLRIFFVCACLCGASPVTYVSPLTLAGEGVRRSFYFSRRSSAGVYAIELLAEKHTSR